MSKGTKKCGRVRELGGMGKGTRTYGGVVKELGSMVE